MKKSSLNHFAKKLTHKRMRQMLSAHTERKRQKSYFTNGTFSANRFPIRYIRRYLSFFSDRCRFAFRIFRLLKFYRCCVVVVVGFLFISYLRSSSVVCRSLPLECIVTGDNNSAKQENKS